ncbi:Retrovirus-related Pol polyprotein from transposon TNT 1-94 [Eumeta japonica]|uniref:Retrovirus-related Pol polyprotein from transposon TNT 1-94 n=1 Tax=Eumeta variegata TaxID=151549 RepID=A0A4C1SXU4_EUMVA|nr:Retrovirus-related Pol polyprotein from transposon TNT 1-94 [Eumeta japonica]
MNGSLLQIEKLDEGNYDSWSIQMKSVLIHNGLWNIANGKLSRPEAAAEKEKWESDDEKALAFLFLGVKSTQLSYIKNCKSSHEAWNKIQEVYMPKGPMQKVSLYKKLVNLTMSDDGNVTQHINDFSKISEKLSEIGIEIQEELLVIMLLSSLPSHFDNFVIAMETRDKLPEFSLIKQKLLEEGKRREEKINNQDTVSRSQQQAFIARSHHVSKDKKPKQKNLKLRCFSCGMTGHYASKCERKQKNTGSNSQAMTMLASVDMQNGVAERANRTLVEMARSMMVHAGVKEYLWAEAVNTAAYIRNRCSTRPLNNKTSHEIWFGRKPNVKHFKTFGAYAVGLNKSAYKSKFEAKGTSYIMVGYSMVSKAYRLFDTVTHSVVERRDVIFDENISNIKVNNNEECVKAEDYLTLYVESPEKSKHIVEADNQPSVVSDEVDEIFDTADEDSSSESSSDQQAVAIGPGRPKIIRSGKPGRPRKQYNVVNVQSNVCVAMNDNVPQTVEEALSSNRKHCWEKAMQDEILALENNSTWSLANLPEGKKAIPCKWVFALKRDVNGEIERYKARLVAKGCNQRFGIDFTDTFSPVVRYSTLRLLLALAVKNKMHLHQMDVDTAYLNSDLHDEIYLKQPPHFVDETSPRKVLRLHKAIYGLKQSGKEWNCKLDSVLRKLNFVRCDSEPCLYKATKRGHFVLIAVYVDDLIVGCSELTVLEGVKKQIADYFKVKDKGVLNHILGMEVKCDGDTGVIELSQTQYILNVLKHYGMEKCKSVSVPLEAGIQVNCSADCKKVNQKDYQSLVGTLMYLAITTRPDILHSVSKMAQRNSDPHVEHMMHLKHILRYLNGTKDLKLIYDCKADGLEGFVDADWAGDALNRKSYTGYIFL